MIRIKALKDLMKGIYTDIKRIFKFEHCAVLFFDRIKDKLYTIALENDSIMS